MCINLSCCEYMRQNVQFVNKQFASFALISARVLSCSGLVWGRFFLVFFVGFKVQTNSLDSLTIDFIYSYK